MKGKAVKGRGRAGMSKLAGDTEQKQAGPTGPGTHTFENEELAEGQLGIQQLFRSRESFSIVTR